MAQADALVVQWLRAARDDRGGRASALRYAVGVAVDHASGHAHLPAWGAGAAVAVPVALYLLSVWLLHAGPQSLRRLVYPLAALLILAAMAAGEAVLVIGLLAAVLVAVRLLARPPRAIAERA